MRNNQDIIDCVICGKELFKGKRKMKGKPKIRKNAVTCSRKCSRIHIRNLNKESVKAWRKRQDDKIKIKES